MADASISGLASGLDTATIINQLMALEAAPQTRLKSRLSTEQSTLKSLQDLNARIAALATKAADLAKPASWTVFSATSSSTGVKATAGSGAVPGTLSVHVDQVAVAHRLTFATTAAQSDVVVTGGTQVKLTVAGQEHTLETGDGTLAGLVSAVNAADLGVWASTVRLDNGSYRLSLQAETTGAASAFTITDSTGGTLLGGSTVVTGTDAAVTIGADTIHAAGNTFTGVVPGLEFTVSADAVGSTVTLTVAPDPAAATTKVKGLVDAVNNALGEIDRLTAYNATTKTAGPLAGDSTLRDLRSALLGALYGADGSGMADAGLQTDKTGKLVFDEEAFKKALADDPEGLAARFTTAGDGWGVRVRDVAEAASDRFDGTLTQAITGRTAGIDAMEDSIDSWNERLELRRASLTRQFTALETALSQMQSQSSWLAGQIASLGTGSGQ